MNGSSHPPHQGLFSKTLRMRIELMTSRLTVPRSTNWANKEAWMSLSYCYTAHLCILSCFHLDLLLSLSDMLSLISHFSFCLSSFLYGMMCVIFSSLWLYDGIRALSFYQCLLRSLWHRCSLFFYQFQLQYQCRLLYFLFFSYSLNYFLAFVFFNVSVSKRLLVSGWKDHPSQFPFPTAQSLQMGWTAWREISNLH